MRNFIIVGTQRTGSSALGEAIGLHPEIVCGWEWTNHTIPWKKVLIAKKALQGDFEYLLEKHRNYLLDELSEKTEWLGYRRLFGATDKWFVDPAFSVTLLLDRFAQHIDWFRSERDLHIIHIVRRDDLDWLKSKYISRSLNSYIGKTYPEHLKVKVPVRNAIRRVRAKHWIDKELGKLSSSNPYIKIEYEDLAVEFDSQIKAVASFLGYDDWVFDSKKTATRKQSTLHARDYISNYDELLFALKSLDQ